MIAAHRAVALVEASSAAFGGRLGDGGGSTASGTPESVETGQGSVMGPADAGEVFTVGGCAAFSSNVDCATAFVLIVTCQIKPRRHNQ